MTARELHKWLEWQMKVAGPNVKVKITGYTEDGKAAIKEAKRKWLLLDEKTREMEIVLMQ